MSVAEYKDGTFVAYWDFECPLCFHKWDNDGDPIPEDGEVEEQCPKCKAELLITACYSVDYEVNVKPGHKEYGEGAR